MELKAVHLQFFKNISNNSVFSPGALNSEVELHRRKETSQPLPASASTRSSAVSWESICSGIQQAWAAPISPSIIHPLGLGFLTCKMGEEECPLGEPLRITSKAKGLARLQLLRGPQRRTRRFPALPCPGTCPLRLGRSTLSVFVE